MNVAEQIADLVSETKYSISLFSNGQRLNLNDRIGDLRLGHESTKSQVLSHIICLKGAIDAPKIFNRFKQVDAPERQLSYIADEEAHDAISFIPKKDIKFAGFSVYHVASNLEQDFRCLYKMKIGAETYAEKSAEFTQSEVENKMVDIMMP